MHRGQAEQLTLKRHSTLRRNIPSASREPRPLRAHLDQPGPDPGVLVLLLRFLLALLSPQIRRRDVRFADIAEDAAVEGGRVVLFFFRGVRIGDVVGGHELVYARGADDMAAWFGDCHRLDWS